jgi:VanZ family protein
MTKGATVFGYWLATLAFVVYGSLVPLDFQPIPLAQALAAFADIRFRTLGIESRADWVANGVLYLPLGFLSARLAHASLARWPYPLAMLLAVCWCVAVAIGVEFTQLFFPPRTVSQNDLIAETIGSVLGAALAPVLARWVDRIHAAWVVGGQRLGWRLLEVYVALYLALCLFPYDLLLSWQELSDKALSGSWGWLFASGERGLWFTLLQWLVEVGLVVPIGALYARRHAAQRLSNVTVGVMAALLGAMLGLAIEGGQFLLASGVSQGASVLSRMAGMAVGALAAPVLATGGVSAVQALLRRHGVAALAGYLPVLLFVNGWFRLPWHGVAGAAAVWSDLMLLPFYYHYYTTEAIAVFSLGSVALMYLPAAVLGWAHGWRRATTLTLVALMVLLIETSKLFITGLHPDPTNLIIAVAAAALALKLAAMAQQPAVPAASVAAAVPRGTSGPRAGWPVLIGLALWAGVSAALFPAFPWGLLMLLVAGAAAVWWRPPLALAIIPAALPVLDLAPWSGRYYWDEFDLLLAVCLVVGFVRTRAAPASRTRLRPLTLAFGLLGASLAISTLRALLPWQPIDDNSFTNYYSAYNALRIVKGAVWAGLFLLLWRRLAASGAARAGMFGAGMVAGLTLTVLWVLWERAAFVHLLDFAAEHRVSGPFSAMHKGGAYLECYLAVASAFVVVWAMQAGHWIRRAAAVFLLAAATYAVMVTYSRNGYAALAVVLVVAAMCGWVRRPGNRRQLALGAALLLGAAVVAVPILSGTYARERLAQSARDLAVRQAHWSDALQLRDDNWATQLFGMGLGRYPESHFWRSQEAVHAASYRLVREGGNTFLRLGAGATLYIEQVVRVPPGAPLTLQVDLRSNRAPATLAASLCEKWLLTSLRCEAATIVAPAPPAGPAQAASAWQPAQVRLQAPALRAQPGAPRPPLLLALHTPGTGATVDVDNVRLEAAAGVNLLANGSFGSGLDRWFFSTDVDPPWHIHSLPLAVLFDQGWLGVLAWAVLIVVALAGSVRLVVRQRALLPAVPAALAAFLVSGSLNTLIDAPRFLWLLLVLLGLAAQSRSEPKGTD